MFVRSKMNIPVVYRKGGYSWTINPLTTTYIDETKVTAKELKACYGNRIDVMSLDNECAVPMVEAPKPVKEEKKVEPFTEELDEQLIDNILEEIEAEIKTETEQVTEETEQVTEETEQVTEETEQVTEETEQVTEETEQVTEETEQEIVPVLDEVPVEKKTSRRTSGKKSNKK